MHARWFTALALASALAALPAVAQQATEAAAEPELRTYYVVFVLENPDFEEEEWVDPALAEHRNERVKTVSDLYVRNLIGAEVAVVTGPLDDGGPIKQVAIMDVATAEEAAAVFENSPGVELGRVKFEVYPWHVPAEVLRRPKHLDKTRVTLLGLLKRPAALPKHSEEQLAEIERGHLEHLRGLVESGELVIAGPIEGGGELRGLMVFRQREPNVVRELVADDPAVKARRLELELYSWVVPRGAWKSLDQERAAEAEAQPQP